MNNSPARQSLDVVSIPEEKVSGPAFSTFAWAITGLHKVSLVEWIKWAAVKFSTKKKPDDKRWINNVAIDVFIAGKWLFLLAAWRLGWKDWRLVVIFLYLLFFNVYTYFYYHLWAADASGIMSSSRERRRFINLVSAIGYSMATYAFLFHRVFAAEFDWPPNVSPIVASLTFSIGNALTGWTGELRPKTAIGYGLATSELMITFVFVAMLLSNSIRRPGGGERNG